LRLGCWGVKINQERAAIFNTAEKMFHENHLHKKGYDQELLNRFYQSMAVESMVTTVYYINSCNLHRLHIIFFLNITSIRLHTTATAVNISRAASRFLPRDKTIRLLALRNTTQCKLSMFRVRKIADRTT
jgi:hypothetical protein